MTTSKFSHVIVEHLAASQFVFPGWKMALIETIKKDKKEQNNQIVGNDNKEFHKIVGDDNKDQGWFVKRTS